ncbi:MAG: CcoQ/FixQ family Cbb3-type cytochrome c oxidase assembly chaperone [Bacteroidia bacterium]
MGKMIGFVEGADIYLIVALIVFILVFVITAIYLTMMTKEEEDLLANLPLSKSKKESHEN